MQPSIGYHVYLEQSDLEGCLNYIGYSSHPYCRISCSVQFIQSLIHVWSFATPWTTARQAPLFITNFQRLPKPVSIELVMPSSHLILGCPLLLLPSIFPSIRVFSNESASTSILPLNTKDWSPLGWTGWIFLQSKGLSTVFSNTTVQKHQFFSTQLSL